MRSCQEKWYHSTPPSGAKTVHSASPSGTAEPRKSGTRTARPFPRRLGRGVRWAEVCGALTYKRFVQVDSISVCSTSCGARTSEALDRLLGD